MATTAPPAIKVRRMVPNTVGPSSSSLSYSEERSDGGPFLDGVPLCEEYPPGERSLERGMVFVVPRAGTKRGSTSSESAIAFPRTDNVEFAKNVRQTSVFIFP